MKGKEVHYYRVAFFLPPEATGRTYGQTMCLGVGAVDIVGAIDATLELHPLARIDSVVRQGSIANWPGGQATAAIFAGPALPGDEA